MKSIINELDLNLTSISLDYCWVCKIRFTDCGGDLPNFFKHNHHMVPRAYGGVDGPTVSLCDSHHTALHQIALRLERGKPFNHLLTGDNTQDKRLLWLATIVVNAHALTTDDPNKPMPITFVANRDTKTRLRALKKIYRQPYGSLIQYAIQILYSKHFMVEVSRGQDLIIKKQAGERNVKKGDNS